MVPTQSQCPKTMLEVTYETKIFLTPKKIDDFWRRLNLRETFTRGQIFPYRVEFMANSSEGPFQDGELNIHHGPLLSAHGAIDGVGSSHRGLAYSFGSYVLSFRLIRLVRLDFYRETAGIRVSLRAFIAPRLFPFWSIANQIFWRLFPPIGNSKKPRFRHRRTRTRQPVGMR